MAIKLFRRSMSINIGGLLIATAESKTGELKDTLRVGFKVTLATKKDPNTADFVIYNLRKDNRAAIQEKNQVIDFKAGYIDNESQIFLGALNHADSVLDGRDWVSSIQAGDAGLAFKKERINTSIKGPVGVGEVLKAAADALGVNLGNVAEKISAGSLRTTLTEFANGIVLSGKAEQQMDKIVKSMGYTWSIQAGQLQLLGPTETIGTQAFVLSSQTGLIDVPEAGEDGLVKLRSLLQPELLPGKKIKLESDSTKNLNGFYRADKVVFVGDTWGNDWYVEIEGKPVT